METDPSLASPQLRPRIIGAAAALLVILAACSGNSAEQATSTDAPPIRVSSTQAVTPSTAPAAAAAAAPGELLDAALTAYADGYEFSTTTIVNDQAVTAQTGRWLDGASQIVVTSGDAKVEFLITPNGQWTRLPDGEWEAMDTAPETGYPLDGMREPESLEMLTSAGGRTKVMATYPAADVGLSGDPVEVLLDFEDRKLVGFSFTADIDGAVVESTATLRPISDTTPVTAPTG